ncbi:unnamed protein product [Penicillium bialowiezense]
MLRTPFQNGQNSLKNTDCRSVSRHNIFIDASDNIDSHFIHVWSQIQGWPSHHTFAATRFETTSFWLDLLFHINLQVQKGRGYIIEEAAPLDERFVAQKKRLLAERGDEIKKSWDRLLNRLREEIGTIERHGPSIVPSIDFKDIHVAPEEFQRELRKRGVAVVRGVIPQDEARGYKEAIEAYARANPGTKGVLDPIASQTPDSALTR